MHLSEADRLGRGTRGPVEPTNSKKSGTGGSALLRFLGFPTVCLSTRSQGPPHKVQAAATE